MGCRAQARDIPWFDQQAERQWRKDNVRPRSPAAPTIGFDAAGHKPMGVGTAPAPFPFHGFESVRGQQQHKLLSSITSSEGGQTPLLNPTVTEHRPKPVWERPLTFSQKCFVKL